MKRFLLASLVLCLAFNLWATDFTADGVSYTVLDPANNTVSVGTGNGTAAINTSTSKGFVIPSSVVGNGITYSVTAVGDNAFSGCKNLSSVSIPSSIVSLGTNSFLGCSGLKAIHVDQTDPSGIMLGSTVFSGVASATCTLYIPIGTINAYAAAPQWSAFSNTVEEGTNALHFDGVNDYVSIPSVATNLSTFSIEMWIKPTVVPASGNIALLNTTSWDATNGSSVHFQTEGSKVIVSVYGITTGWPSSNYTPVVNVWQHIAMTYDRPNNTIKFYVNGALVSTVNKTLPVAKIDAACIGAWGGTQRFFNGTIDEVRIWKTVRSAAEITENMSSPIADAATNTNLLAYYPFDEGLAGGSNSGITSLTNKTGSALNGTLVNFGLTGKTSNWVKGCPFATTIESNMIPNPGAETGGAVDLLSLGWGATGNPLYQYNNIVTPHSGSWVMAVYSGNGVTTTRDSYYDFSINDLATSVDNGELTANLAGWLVMTGAGGGVAKIELDMQDANGNPLYDLYGNPVICSFPQTTSANTWQRMSINEPIVKGTRKLRVLLYGSVTNGAAAFDDLSLIIKSTANKAPSVSSIAPQTTNSGETLGPISYTVGDDQTDPADLAVSATSDNTALIANANITLGGSDANRTIKVKSTSGQSGTANITIAVYDGTNTTRSTFAVTVNPSYAMGVNLVQNPNGGSVAGWNGETSRFLLTGGKFTVGSTGGTVLAPNKTLIYQDINLAKFRALIDAGFIQFTGTSTLTGTGECTFQGLDAYGTVLWTKSSGTVDANTKTIRVTIGGFVGATISAVNFTILATGFPKCSEIGDQNLSSGSSTGPLPFVIGYTGAGVITATSSNTALIPNANIELGGVNYQRTIKVNSLPTSSGSATITILADGAVAKTFAVVVCDVPGAPTNVSAVAERQNAIVTFSAPASNGGKAITLYTVTSNPDGITATGASSPITVSGLTVGKQYTFTVTATNEIGDGAASNQSNAVLPTALISISSFSPLKGEAGATVTINGTNFNASASNNAVYFGATKATVLSATTTTLTVTVPSEASFGPVSVTDITTNITSTSSQAFCPIFTGSSIVAFALKQDVTKLESSIGSSVIDVDGDGKADIAVANYVKNNIVILPNTSTSGAIAFGSVSTSSAELNLKNITMKDVDGDGKPDLISVNEAENSLSIMLNKSTAGNTAFAARVSYAVGASPKGIVVCDMDGDGKLDIAVTNKSDNTVSVLRNTSSMGACSFAPAITLATPTTPYCIVSGDIDGDGKSELVVNNWDGHNVSVFHNVSTEGSIAFEAAINTFVGQYPANVAVCDFDGDGKLDIVVTATMNNRAVILPNQSTVGNISFKTPKYLETNFSPESIAIGDFDGNGQPDIALSSYTTTDLSVFLNLSTAGEISFPRSVGLTGEQHANLQANDIDGDGKCDLISNASNGQVSVFRNTTELASLSLDKTSFSLDGSDIGEHYVSITSNTIWTAASNQDWLAVSPASATGNGAITLAALENSTDEPRVAIVTVSASGLTPKSITITQAASATSGVKSHQDAPIAICPNPATDHFVITGLNCATSLQLFDTTGKLVMTQEVDEGVSVPVSNLSNGVYIVKIAGKRLRLIKE